MKTVPVARVVRSGFVESTHYGSVVILDSSGNVLIGVGEVDQPIFPRSCNKVAQVVAMVRAGLDLDDELLALAAASHSGADFHLKGVQRILSSAGLDETSLGNPTDLPYGDAERRAWLREGLSPSVVAHNCSGKHAAMLATCVAAGWPLAGYLEPWHPLQRHIASVLEELAAEPISAVGVDGCGAPVMAISLAGLARSFSAVATGKPSSAEGRVGAALRAHPQWLGGMDRDVSTLMEVVPGLIAKDGFEGVYAGALPNGVSIALKVADGGERALTVVMAAALAAAGVGMDRLHFLATSPVLGGGIRVGSVQAVTWPVDEHLA